MLVPDNTALTAAPVPPPPLIPTVGELVYPDPGALNDALATVVPVRDAAPAAPDPPPPENETDGAEVYPDPPEPIATDVTRFTMFAVAAAPDPPPPENTTVGADV
jgi:hypothetical protein